MTSSKSVSINGTFSPRVMELRKKIHDASYIDFAVQRIAQVLSRKIVEDSEQALMRRRNESK
jgi:hypothetical protein